MSVLEAFILALVQGITEFLPVSSSGHLVFVQSLFKLQSTALVGFDVYVHFGTLLSLFLVYWRDVWAMVQETLRPMKTLKFREAYRTSEPLRLGIALIVGCIPAGVLGILLRDEIEHVFNDPKMVAVNLVLTGLVLFLTRLSRPKEGRTITLWVALSIGFAQAIAVLPGISRSGMTIAMGLFLGITPVLAARFSFLLSIPVIAGATLLEARHISHYASELGILPIATGVVVAALSGYVAIRFLLSVVQRGKFSVFAFYCLLVGSVAILIL